MDLQQQAERSIIKKYRKPIWNKFVGGVKDYHLIEEGDRIAVCLSGGKDSMLLAKCMQELQRHSYLRFGLEFITMDPGYSPENRALIEKNAASLGVPLRIFETDVFETVSKTEESPCYLCARMRRGYLYKFAQSIGCNKIALGHHFDDVIETVLMSMLYSAEARTMMPKLRSRNYEGMELIRPLYLVREQEIIAWARYNRLTFLQCACRRTENRQPVTGADGGRRSATKALLRDLRRQSPQVDANIFRSIHNVNLRTVIGYTDTAGKYHNFLDEYEGRTGRPEYAVFDLDGTILDSASVWRKADTEYLARFGITPGPELWDLLSSRSLPEGAALLVGRYGLQTGPDETAEAIRVLVRQAYAETVTAKPFARDYLEQLQRQKVPVCAATCSEPALLQPALDRLALSGFFAFIADSESLGCSKADPGFYRQVAALFGTQPAALTVFDDELPAIRSAKEAGCRTVAIYDCLSDGERSRIKVLCDYYAGGFDALLEAADV